ncbi:flagellar hook-length control protein FliK [Cognatiyoonia sp. IB215182]|nr:flagellar hook-length control protein FliK [Cognatiyoonia sp. IB215182]
MVAPPSGRPVDRAAPKSAQPPEQEDEGLDFAATFALETDQGEKQVRLQGVEAESQPLPGAADLPLEEPDIAVAELPEATGEPGRTATLEEDKKLTPRPDSDRPISSQDMPKMKAKEAQGPSMAKASIPAEPASMTQRLVEGQMPSPDGKTVLKAKELGAEQMKTPATATTAGPEKVLTFDQQSDETPVAPATSKDMPKKPALAVPTAAQLSDEKSLLPLREELLPQKLDKRDISFESRNPPKAAHTITREAPVPVQATPLAQMIKDASEPSASMPLGDVEVTQTLLVSDRPAASAALQVATTQPAHGAETARQIAQQLAVSVTQSTGRATEIALHPEELGRVRLAMTSLDAAITLSVTAERPETVDLLRRNIDILAQEFRDLGYDDINFSFEGGDKSDDEPTPEALPDMNAASETLEGLPRPQAGSNSVLDLRL